MLNLTKMFTKEDYKYFRAFFVTSNKMLSKRQQEGPRVDPVLLRWLSMSHHFGRTLRQPETQDAADENSS